MLRDVLTGATEMSRHRCGGLELPSSTEAVASPSDARHRWRGNPLAARYGSARIDRVTEHYQAPGWFTTNVFNRLVATLTRAGVSVYGSRVLEVRGRKSGEWRQTPVNLLQHEGAEYLVAPRGHTQWVKNLRVSGEGRLRVGRRTQSFGAVELSGEEAPAVLRAYLKKWKFEVGVFFDGLGPESSDEELRRIAPDHPIFRLTDSR